MLPYPRLYWYFLRLAIWLRYCCSSSSSLSLKLGDGRVSAIHFITLQSPVSSLLEPKAAKLTWE